MTRIALSASVLALIAATGWGWAQHQSAATWQAKAEYRAAELAICSARNRNIQEDRKSDDQIDAIPDSDLRNVPGRWLLPPSR
jgi:type II secretory pathway pseudopilin PulG